MTGRLDKDPPNAVLDLETLRCLQEDFSAATGLATSILDVDGRVLSSAGGSELCTGFHRASPAASRCCLAHNRRLAGAVAEKRSQVVAACELGLHGAAIPVVVAGRHLVTVSVGQVFFNRPDVARFRAQARELGLDEEAYLAALNRVRVVPEAEFMRAVRFLGKVIGLVVSQRQRNWEQRTILDSIQSGVVVIDAKAHTIVEANRVAAEIIGLPVEEVVGKVCHEFICPAEKGNCPITDRGLEVDRSERVLITRDGTRVPIIKTVVPVEMNGGEYLIESFIDITTRKRMEEQLVYLSMHDPLTGLYNRAYFEEEMRRLEAGRHRCVGIIVCDVDGLKLVNDVLGHGAGDKLLKAAAGIMADCFREGDVVARVGGDEFAVLLPDGDAATVEGACRRIRGALAEYAGKHPELPLSMSIGFAVGDEEASALVEAYRRADNNMYREKLLHGHNARGWIVKTLMKALEARDFVADGHVERLQAMVTDMALDLGLTERSVTGLRLLAQFHDIGKVGISERVLFKPGPLTREESAEIERHCEIGHRIALSLPGLASIADWILKHHEWWNGRGYPLGLKGEEIPLECRILAIADAFDSMTSARPYRSGMSRADALAELRRCAGAQFDPQLVQRFLRRIGLSR